MSGESARVYIGDLGSNGSKPEIEEAFKKFGPLKSVWVARNPPGFAFVEFEDARDAEDCVKELNGTKVCGVNIRVEIAKNSSRASSGRYRGDSDNDRRRRSRSRSPERRPGPRYSDRSDRPDRPYYDRRRDYGGRSPSPPPYMRRSRSPARFY